MTRRAVESSWDDFVRRASVFRYLPQRTGTAPTKRLELLRIPYATATETKDNMREQSGEEGEIRKPLNGTTQSRQIHLGQEAAHDGEPLGVGQRTDTSLRRFF